MRRIVSFLVTFFIFGASAGWAEFSYTRTTRVTGGSLLNMTRFIPGAGSIKEPQTHTIAIKGGKMVTYDKDNASIIDADAETMTQIDFKKKQYSMITFAEMKQAMLAMRQQLEQMQAQLKAQGQELPAVNPLDSIKISVKDTGQSKQISGLDTKNYILTMEMSPPPGAPPNLLPKTTMDSWVTPKLPGYDEVTQFGLKLASKLSDFMPDMGNLGMSRPDIAKSTNAMSKEMTKINGIPVYETFTMRTVQQAGPGGASGPSLGGAVKEGAKQGAEEGTRDAVRSKLGRLGGVGGLGGLGRKKEEPPKPADQPAKEVTWQEVTLLEQVTELTNLSSTVDASKFAVPAGFKQVEHEMKKLANRK
jgi:hypothetical protein